MKHTKTYIKRGLCLVMIFCVFYAFPLPKELATKKLMLSTTCHIKDVFCHILAFTVITNIYGKVFLFNFCVFFV